MKKLSEVKLTDKIVETADVDEKILGVKTEIMSQVSEKRDKLDNN